MAYDIETFATTVQSSASEQRLIILASDPHWVNVLLA